MAGAFGEHLVDSFLSASHYPKGPFGQEAPTTPQTRSHGAYSFAPTMHGAFDNAGFGTSMTDSSFMPSEETARKIATLQAKLNKKLGPEYVSTRSGAGGAKLHYVEGWKMINLANEVFGFNGWSSSIVSMNTDFIDCDPQTGRCSAGVSAIVRVTLRDGVFHEDTGYGSIENVRGKAAVLDKVSTAPFSQRDAA